MIQGQIYKTIINIDNDIYIGSTTNSLHLRFAVHIMTATYTKSKHRLLYKQINELGIEHFKIELVDEITCEDKKDLHALEGYYILQYGTLNRNLAGSSLKD